MLESERKVASAIILIISIIMGFITLGIVLHERLGNVAQFTWHWYALPLILAALTTFTTLTLMLRRVTIKRKALYWFGLLMATCGLFLVALTFEALAANPETEVFFQNLLAVAWMPESVFLLLFTTSYIDRRETSLTPQAWMALLLTMIFLIFAIGVSDMVEYHVPVDPTLHWWGYSNSISPTGGWAYAWGAILAIMSLVLLIRAYRREYSKIARKQLRLFIIAIAQFVAAAIIFDIALRLVFPNKLPPFVPIYNTILSILIGYGVLRYGMFQINPASLSEQILEDLSEAVVGTNAHFEIEFANSGVRTIFGRQPHMLSGQPIATLVGTKSWHLMRDTIAERDGNRIAFDDIKVPHNDAEEDVMVMVSKVYGDQGKVAGYIFVFQNISELVKKTIELAHEKANIEHKVQERTRELHEERAKLHASIESLALGFALIGPDGKVLIHNHVLESMLQIESVTTTGDIAKRMHGFALAKYSAEAQKPDAPKILKEVTYGEKVLRIFIAGVTTLEHNSNKPIGSVILIEDITEMKVLERSRDEFFSIASHELRTPLTAIRGNTSMLLEYYPDVKANHDLSGALTDIHDSSVRLIDIVNDFLDLSRLEQRRIAFDLKPVHLDKTIESVIYEMHASIRERHLTVKYDGMTLGQLPLVWADESRVKQIVYNLVGNAVKFTENGTVVITSVVEDNKVKIFITDSGRGIAVESRKLLFHKFQQAGQSILTRDTTRGTGLGLYISKLLIEEMGGHVVLEHSEPDKGSTFSFTLPIATDKQIEQWQAAAQAPTTAN